MAGLAVQGVIMKQPNIFAKPLAEHKLLNFDIQSRLDLITLNLFVSDYTEFTL